jgi:hypothetical protein
MKLDYWREAFAAALDVAGIDIQGEQQLESAAEVLVSYYDTYGMSNGYECISDPRDVEIKTLKKALSTEREKVTCDACGGSGCLVRGDSVRSSESQCWKCSGEGRYLQ